MAVLHIAALLLAALGVGEIGCLVYFLVRDGRFISMSKRRENLLPGSMHVKGIIPTDVSYYETVFPHPWLGFVHHANPPLNLSHINNVGLFGRDFPTARDEAYYTILLTGGSVAAQFGQTHPNGPLFLEEYLNRHYASPNGKPFRTLNGGDGAWKQPQQAILLLLHINAIDAVVSLEGFNEYFLLGGESNLALPAQNFEAVSPLATNTRTNFLGRSISTALKKLLVETPVLRSSFLAMLVLTGLSDWIARRWVARYRGEWRTTVKSLFALPDAWSPEMRRSFHTLQYKSFLLSMEALARRFGLKSAYFIQPIPAIDKPLTPEEQTIADSDMAAGYLDLRDTLLELKSQGLSIWSLTDLFKDETSRIYADWIHCLTGPDGESRGYRLMAKAIGDMLATSWNLARTDGRPTDDGQAVSDASGNEPKEAQPFAQELKALGGQVRYVENLETMVQNLRETLKDREETIARLQAKETERLRQQLISQGLLPPDSPSGGN